MEGLPGTLIEEARLNRETMTAMGRDLSSGLAAVKREVASANRRLDLLTEAVRHGAVIDERG